MNNLNRTIAVRSSNGDNIGASVRLRSEIFQGGSFINDYCIYGLIIIEFFNCFYIIIILE
jgi:hypothetical protein